MTNVHRSRLARSFAFTLSLLVASSGIAGCAAFARKQIHGGTNVVTPLPADLSRYRALGFRATSTAGAPAQVLSEISQRVVAGIRSGGEFEQVIDLTAGGGSSVDLELQFQVTEFNDVSSQDRFWMGGAAGRAMIAGPLTLTETASGRVLGAAAVTAYTDNMNTRSGTTEDAVQRAAQEVIGFMAP